MAQHRIRFSLAALAFCMAIMVMGARTAVMAADAAAPAAGIEGRIETDLAGAGWRMWRDVNAKWQDDELFLPPVDVSKLPVNPPTDGWEALQGDATIAVSIPGTVEEYATPAGVNPKETSPAKLYKQFQGVSWWTRTIRIPDSATNHRVLLRFESVRLRAEVFVNQKLVGYDLIEGTPFEVDITDAARPGQECQLAVRITNPGGNWDWVDCNQIAWGKYRLPESHSFGGITGSVKLAVVDPVYVQDLAVLNTPAMRDATAQISVQNKLSARVTRDLLVRVTEKKNRAVEVYREELKGVEFPTGISTQTVKIAAPGAKLWELENPNLYVCEVSLKSADAQGDIDRRVFGFRWFALDGIGQNAMLRLNGKRIVVRTAISWGFWPTNGITPTPELAEKQIRTAKDLGLNMLNFHRAIGNPIVLDKADELGLLYFEEPGGYVSGGKEPFGQAMAREKLLRMAGRDRSHPSLVIYNMINEQWTKYGADKDDALHEVHARDMRDAHAIDPSRLIVFTSAWAKDAIEERTKMHMRPFDSKQYYSGWADYHRAGGPEVWLEEFYKNPTSHYGLSTNAKEIVYWGEEGAVSAPPRLEKIKADLAAMPHPGWDGAIYLGWYKQFDDFITRKSLRGTFPTVDSLTTAMGAVSLEHQGRKIQDTRICDLNDGYAVNGWEAEPFENHSGIVDCFRNPKGDPAIVAYYNQPLYIAVKVRQRVTQIPGEIVTDFYAINEKNLKGPHTLLVSVKNASKAEVFRQNYPVTLQGGDVYGQLLVEGVKIPVADATGMFAIEASLLDAAEQPRATGHDEILAVDWKSAKLNGNGAVYEWGGNVRDFLNTQKNMDVPAYDGSQGPLDWIVVAGGAKPQPLPIPGDRFIDASGQPGGLTATIYTGRDFTERVHQRVDKQIDFEWSSGATPDPAVGLTENYCIRWEGKILPPVSGQYTLSTVTDDGVRLWLDGKLIIDDWKAGKTLQNKATVELTGGKPLAIRMDYFQDKSKAKAQLLWVSPAQNAFDIAKILDRARDDGTTVIIADYADSWMDLIKTNPAVTYQGQFGIGGNWVGGQYFVKAHPLFRDLPVNQAMNWPYQQLVRNGRSRYALVLEGEELVAGCYNAVGCQLGTAVGIIPWGKGRLIVSTLEISPHLGEPQGPADVARKLLCNYVEFAGPRAR